MASTRIKIGYNDLATTNPELVKEWHPTKNGTLTPYDVTAGSNKKIWWLLPYDDFETGKHFDFEWQASVSNRTFGQGCPYLSGKKILVGYNDLATTNPELAKEWHPTKNGDLTPYEVTAGSNKKVWWQCEKGHEWQVKICSRTAFDSKCPFCSNEKCWPGYNDLETRFPQIVKFWNYKKNIEICPNEVMPGSFKRVWWKCEKGHEWQARIANVVHDRKCPYCANKKVLVGYNDLATTNPELVKEWHPTKNGDLTPYDVTAGSDKKVWWLLPYDDFETGKHFDFEWQTAISARTAGGRCPFLSGEKIWPGYNDFATKNMETAKQWHPTKNGNLTPNEVMAGSNKKVWWKCKDCGFEWESTVGHRNGEKATGCPKCNLMYVHTSFPEQTIFFYIRNEYPEAINGYKDIFDVKGMEIDIYIPTLKIGIEYDGMRWHGEEKLYREKLKYDICKKHQIKLIRIKENREHKIDQNCDYLIYSDYSSGNNLELENIIKTLSQYVPLRKEINIEKDKIKIRELCSAKLKENSILDNYPELAKEWHSTKNGTLTPKMFKTGSNVKVWWQCEKGHEWQATIISRGNGTNCPYCANREVWPGYNDLATTNPELAKEWHPTKNGSLMPSNILAGSHKKVWWQCEKGHEWQATLISRTRQGIGCLVCSNRIVLKGQNDLATLNPELAKEWHPTKNGDLMPCDVVAGTNKKIWWQCEKGHEWQAEIRNRVNGTKCPYCANKKVFAGYNDLATTNPELAKEWHPTKNGGLTPYDVTAGSNKKVWWLLPYDDQKMRKHFDFEWQATIIDRINGRGCPYLTGKKVFGGYNDLATTNPELAKEWHPTKNGDLTPHDVTAGSNKKVWWLNTIGYEWQEMINSRNKKHKNR